jgi:hypothetical protein
LPNKAVNPENMVKEISQDVFINADNNKNRNDWERIYRTSESVQ